MDVPQQQVPYDDAGDGGGGLPSNASSSSSLSRKRNAAVASTSDAATTTTTTPHETTTSPPSGSDDLPTITTSDDSQGSIDEPQQKRTKLEGVAETEEGPSQLTQKIGFGGLQSPTSQDDTTYRGDWKDGKPHGRGYKVWVDGDWYDGDWLDGRQSGRGVYCCPSGRRYEGEWKDGLKHGKGVKVWANGDRYEGEWREDKQHGRGIYMWANGDRYEGEWKDGDLHGEGTKTWENGNRYKGEWRKDVKHGFGIKTWANGDRYEGTWAEGIKHGKGVYIWKNGDKYVGEWEQDKKHGKGVFVFSNGRKKEGYWQNDLKHGAFTYTDDHGKQFHQTYKSGKLVSSTARPEQSSVTNFAHFVASAQHWFGLLEKHSKLLEDRTLEVEQLRAEIEGRDVTTQELRVSLRECQMKITSVQEENARLIGGGSESCSLEELQVLERTLERSRTLVSTRISIIHSRQVLAEKSQCSKCEGSKEVVFIPCGHRTLCQKCAEPVTNCPACGAAIASTVRTHDG